MSNRPGTIDPMSIGTWLVEFADNMTEKNFALGLDNILHQCTNCRAVDNVDLMRKSELTERHSGKQALVMDNNFPPKKL